MLCPACGSENIDGNDRCENCLAPFRDLDVPRADSAEGLSRSVMEDTLDQLDYEEPVLVTSDTPAIEVAARMRDAQVGCALVVDQGKLVGIFTEHDVLLKMTGDATAVRSAFAAAEDRPVPPGASGGSYFDPDLPSTDIPFEEIRLEEETTKSGRDVIRVIGDGSTAVKEFMSLNPETLHEHESVAVALNKMSLGRYRHLPIERADGSYAVASIKSVLKYIAQEEW